MPTTILLADDHRLMRQGLGALLRGKPEYEVVAEAETGAEAVRLAKTLTPDVVIMDLCMPDLDGIQATRQITQNGGPSKVIGLTGVTQTASGTEMLLAGAMGFLFKLSAADELFSSIAAVMSGEVYVSPSIATTVMTDYVTRDRSPAGQAALSRREHEVLRLVAEGRSTKQAAMDLKVSVKTIETHRRNLMEKLQIDNVACLTKYAIRHGLCAL